MKTIALVSLLTSGLVLSPIYGADKAKTEDQAQQRKHDKKRSVERVGGGAAGGAVIGGLAGGGKGAVVGGVAGGGGVPSLRAWQDRADRRVQRDRLP